MANEFTDTNVTGNLGMTGDIVIDESADHAATPAAGKGILWVRNDTPCVFVFTDDAGTDTVISSGSGDVTGPASSTDNGVPTYSGSGGKTLQYNSSATLDDSSNIAGLANVSLSGDVILAERADHASTPGAGFGYLWVKNSTPSALYFTDDAGTDTDLTASASGDVSGPASGTDNAIVRMDGTGGKTIQNSGVTIDDSDNIASAANVSLSGDVILAERADHASTPGAGFGYIWVKSDTPSSLYFTDDAGTDYDLTASGSGDVSKVGTPVDGQIGVWTGDGTIEGDSALTFDTTDDTLVIAASGKLGFGAVDILSDSAGTTTLQNIDALDATTEATIEAAIDTLANLTSIQGQTVTVSGTTTVSGTNTGDVTLAGTPDYLTISGQEITRGLIDLTTDVTGDLPLANLAQFAQGTIGGRAAGAGTGDLTALTLLQVQTILNTPVAITSSANATAWNSDNGRIFTHTLTENTTISASSGTLFAGQMALFRIVQAAGSYTLAWNAAFTAGSDFSDTIPAVSSTNGDVDYYLFYYDGTNLDLLDHRLH